MYTDPLPTHVLPPHTVVCLAADSSETQFTWLRTLGQMGLEVLPSANEADDFIKNAASIFEFEAKTIDDELVSLDKYR